MRSKNEGWDCISMGSSLMDKEYTDALFKQLRFYTETMTILSNEANPRLNKLAALLKNTEAIEVVNDVAVQIIPFNNDEVMKAVQDFDTFIMVTSEVTTELERILKQNATNNKAGFLFSYKEVDEMLKLPMAISFIVLIMVFPHMMILKMNFLICLGDLRNFYQFF
uniref:Uncharacterized protein n=1 Tax=Panagrolaimus sp. PS1159 TaxID=55785 RepID=A0AC35GSM3_9BILA